MALLQANAQDGSWKMELAHRNQAIWCRNSVQVAPKKAAAFLLFAVTESQCTEDEHDDEDEDDSKFRSSGLENGPDPEGQTDERDECTAQYFTIPFECAKSHPLQSRGRIDAQEHVGRDRAEGEHNGHHHD